MNVKMFSYPVNRLFILFDKDPHIGNQFFTGPWKLGLWPGSCRVFANIPFSNDLLNVKQLSSWVSILSSLCNCRTAVTMRREPSIVAPRSNSNVVENDYITATHHKIKLPGVVELRDVQQTNGVGAVHMLLFFSVWGGFFFFFVS